MKDQTVWKDGHVYPPGVDAPEMGSIHCVGSEGGKREYVGLSKDLDKLPTYDDLESGSAALMIDTSEAYLYEATTKSWYKQEDGVANKIALALQEAKKNGEFKPIKGKDYYTEADKQEIITEVTKAQYTEQNLTDAQQTTARKNIGAAKITYDAATKTLNIISGG